MSKYLLAVLLFIPLSVLAVPSVDLGNMEGTLKLYKETCKHKGIMGYVKDEFKKKMKRAVVSWRAKKYEACYMEHEGMIIGMDENGQTFQYDKNDFKDDVI